MSISVVRGPTINIEDSVKYNGKNLFFQLDDKNETEQELILVYMYVLPSFPMHGVKVGMTICKLGESFWHAIKTRIKNQQHELALTEQQWAR